jgi:hypothetical protein
MASPASAQINSTGGFRLAGANYSESGVTVFDEKTIHGEPYLPNYVVNPGASGSSIATANDHTMQLMASSSLGLYVRRILVYQSVAATTAAIASFAVFGLTTAGTGGTSTTPARLDNDSAAASSTGMIIPTAKGTEGRRIWSGNHMMMQTVPTSGGSLLMFDLIFDGDRLPAIRVPVGTTNGIAFKNITAVAGASISVNIYYAEASF